MDKIWGVNTVSTCPRYFGAWRLRYALESLKKVKGKVLEVGCGGGAFVRAIKSNRPDLEVWGGDLDSRLAKLAQKMDRQNSYLRADVQRLPFKDNSFEAVLAFDMIEHLNNPQLAFREIFRVLKKGGLFHASIPLEGSPATLHGLFLKIGFRPKEKYAGHLQQFCLSEVVQMHQQVGFSKISWSFSGHFFYQLIDLSYFSCLSWLKKKPVHTVEGYLTVLPGGFFPKLLAGLTAVLASLCFWESKFLKNIPGQIGHFTAVKP